MLKGVVMKQQFRFAFVLCVLILLSSSGCGAKQRRYSGFLGDYSKLKPHPERKSCMYYQDPELKLVNYSKFIIDHVIVHFAPDAEGISIDPEKLGELKAHFETGLKEALSKHYEVVEEPGAGVLRLRMAITDIKKTKAAWNIHPATKLAGFGLGSASMEAEAIDTGTGRRVAAIVETREGSRLAFRAGFQEMGHAKQIIDEWIERFVKRVNAAHGIES